MNNYVWMRDDVNECEKAAKLTKCLSEKFIIIEKILNWLIVEALCQASTFPKI